MYRDPLVKTIQIIIVMPTAGIESQFFKFAYANLLCDIALGVDYARCMGRTELREL